jgi:3-hydroxy-3-methylglutaryl CoA synthase
LIAIRGSSFASDATLASYLKSLDESLSAYERKVERVASKTASDSGSAQVAKAVKLSDFDFSIFESPKADFVQKAYNHMVSINN